MTVHTARRKQVQRKQLLSRRRRLHLEQLEDRRVLSGVTFSKEFAPDTIFTGEVSTLEFIITTGESQPVDGVAFTDNLPAGVQIATPPNASFEGYCGEPSLTATAGTSVISLSDASVYSLEGGDCHVSVDVTSFAAGTYVNVTGQLTSDDQTSPHGTATDTLTVLDRSNLGFSKSFSPSTIGSGSTTQLSFEIRNAETQTAVTDIAFTDILPQGITLANPPSGFTSCSSGSLSFPNGGTTISLTGARLPANDECSVTVNVIGTATATNVSGYLTASDGYSPKATATLTVDPTLPGVSKSFSPSTISLGQTSRLTLAIDNTGEGAVDRFNLSLLDNLPTGMVVASPSNAATDCFASLTASAGTSTVSLSANGFAPNFPVLTGGSTCTVTVDVTTESNGVFVNTTGELTTTAAGQSAMSSGFATAELNVPVTFLSKVFTNDPVSPGGTVNLEFTINNMDRSNAATSISFNDVLDPLGSLAGLVPGETLPKAVCGGNLDFAGGSLTFSGGSLPEEGSCTFNVALAVPANAPAGTYLNTTTAITAIRDGQNVVGNMATDRLVVSTAPTLTKQFLNDPVGPGGSVSLEFTITNPDPNSPATAIVFTDDLPEVIVNTAGDPPSSVCNGGTLAFTALTNFNPARITVTGASLDEATSCTFSLDLLVAAGAPGGSYLNTTSEITATLGGESVVGAPASDTLIVVESPRLTKEFIDDPVAPGGTTNLQFTLSYGTEGTVGDAANVSFTDDLDAALTGLAATGLPINVCGGTLSGTTMLEFAGGSLEPGTPCTFSVALDVPGSASPGAHTNTTSNITATVSGVAVTGNSASDDLQIASLTLTKEFLDDPVIAGGTTTLHFTLDNPSAVDATGISFTDNLGSALTGLVAVAPLPTSPCGATTFSGTSVLTFSGGSVAAGTSCSFDVSVMVPAGTDDGSYFNRTSQLISSLGTGAAASDQLVVNSTLLGLTKEFTDDPVAAGGNVMVEFTLTNLDASRPASAISFSDDLGATLTGLTFESILLDTCGEAAGGIGTTTLSVTGVSLPAGGTCTIRGSLAVPADAVGGVYPNTTSAVAGTIGGLAVAGLPASDDLLVSGPLTFSKSFNGPTTATGTPVLTFTITNSNSETADSIAFSDDLNAVITGLAATNLPLSNVCGVGSLLSGTSTLMLSGGELGPMSSCTFSAELLVPGTATAGTFPNATSVLTQNGLTVAAPARADLIVEPPPTFAKSFAPDTIGAGEVSTLTLTVDNSASAVAASGLSFVDNFPAGLVIADPTNAATTCVGGMGDASPGATSFSFAGGSVDAGASCTVQVDVTSDSGNVYVNTTGDLTSSSGNSGPASDTLTVEVLEFDKSFVPAVIGVGSTSTLTFEILNLSNAPVTSLAFTDNLPADLFIASPANVSSTCGGTITAPNGGMTIELSGGGVGVPGSCTISVDVTGSVAKTYTNETSLLQSSAGSAPPAVAELLVANDRPGFTKDFVPDSISLGARSTLTFTIDNRENEGSSATALDFTDNLPAGIVVASPTNASTTCSGGVVSAVSGTGVISYTSPFGNPASVGAGASCTVSVDVIGTAVGLLGNTTGELTSSATIGSAAVSSGKASAVLEVIGDPLSLVKSFTNDPVLPGGTVNLEFVITNFSRDEAATNITFTDDLTATLSGLVASGLPQSDVCGTGSTLSGTSLLTLSGASLEAGESCTFSVTLDVPAAAATGVYPNTTSSITADVGGASVTGAPGTDDLFVQTVPILTKSFTDDPVGAGGAVNLHFNIQNTSGTFDATDLAFTDNVDAILSGLTVAMLPASGFCGAGSTLTTQSIGGLTTLVMAGGNLPANGSCGFNVTLLLPAGAPGGTFTNTTSTITATVGGQPLAGKPASDDLVVVAAPSLRKEFTNNPVAPGANANLQFTLTYGGGDEEADPPAGDATNINFTDNLNAALAGLSAVGLPINDVCGTGSVLSGTTSLSFTGGSLTPGSTCTFSVPVFVPLASPPGSFTNETSNVNATVAGVTTINVPATDDLRVTGLSISKEFTDDPVPAGGTVTLQFTIDNVSQVSDATNIRFTDNLDDALAGLVATGLPLSDVCGTGSQLTGTSELALTGGNLAAGESCNFSVTLQVPASAASDTYVNTTSKLNAVFGTTPVSLDPATDTLTVASGLLLLDKSFVEDSALPGDTVTLDFTVTNLDASQSVMDITFTDDLDAALAGLVAVGLPASDVCGAGSQLSGTSLLTLTGATLGPGGSCSFSATLQLPTNIPFGSVVSNTTSQVTGDLGGLPVTGDPASDELQIDFLNFSKAFDGLTHPGGTPKLTFTIENLGATAANDISFSDNLGAVIPGLAATGLPTSGVCGLGSQLAGTTTLLFTGGNLGPGASCTFDVTLQVPTNAAAGTYTNVTSDLLVGGITGASPAVDSLTVIPPPEFDKAFTPAGIPVTGTSTLSFSINNSASPVGATSLAFTDNLPAGVTVAVPPNASTSCTGGILTALAGSSVITYSGGAVAAGASCSVQVDVTSMLSGSHLNVSGDLTSSSGNSGPASAMLISQIMLMGGPFTPGLNVLTASKSLPDAISLLVKGTQPGSEQLTIQGVTFTTAFADPVVVAFAETDADGSATYAVFATAAQIGQTLQYQAVQIKPVVDVSTVLSVDVVDAPLLAAGGQADLGQGESLRVEQLTPALLRSLVPAAIERWEELGLKQSEIDRLHAATVQIADLPDGVLGQTAHTTISIDYSAADYGWFVDQTPVDGAEFETVVTATELAAGSTSSAARRMDLLTVLVHEFGHLLGYEDIATQEGSHRVMSAELPEATRRLLPIWQNPSRLLDVDDDKSVTPTDVRLILNSLNAGRFAESNGQLPGSVPAGILHRFYDTDGNGFSTHLDALRIINHLNLHPILPEPEGEAPVNPLDVAFASLNRAGDQDARQDTTFGQVASPVTKVSATLLALPKASQASSQRDLPGPSDQDVDLGLLEWLEEESLRGEA